MIKAARVLLLAASANALHLRTSASLEADARAGALLAQHTTEAEVALNHHVAEFAELLDKVGAILLQKEECDPKKDGAKCPGGGKKGGKKDNSKKAVVAAKDDSKKAVVAASLLKKEACDPKKDGAKCDPKKGGKKDNAKKEAVVEKVKASPEEEKRHADAEKRIAKLAKKIKEPEFPPEMNAFKAKLQDVTGPAMMLPLLEGMYDKFKDDIRSNNKLETESKKRVKKYVDEYEALKKSGKNKYLLEEKLRAVNYFKKQRNIQHRHYHAMLKMAHGMMERLKGVQRMTKAAAEGKKLTDNDVQQLQAMAPPTLVL